jgi:ABC-type amino acid transport substrate-binding protein
MARPTWRIVAAGLALGVLLVKAGPALAETTLEKVGRTGTFVVGTRTGSPPFGFIDKQNSWGGFSVDLAKLVHASIEKKLGKSVKFQLKESTPATRIALLTSGVVDLIAGTMTVTRARHRRQAHRSPAGVDQREDTPREVPAGAAGRVPRSAGGVHRAHPRQDRCLH